MHANGEAAALFERALELWSRVPDAEALAGCDHVELLRRAAQAHDLAGDPNRMRTLLREALDEVDRDAEPRARRGRCSSGWAGRAGTSARATRRSRPTTRRSRSCRRASRPRSGRACSPRRAGRGCSRGSPARRTGAAQAIEAARAAGARAVEQHALNTLGVVPGRRAATSRAARRRCGGRSRWRARTGSSTTSTAAGRTSPTRSTSSAARPRRATSRSRASRSCAASGHCRWLTLTLIEIQFHLGEWDGAAETARRRTT